MTPLSTKSPLSVSPFQNATTSYATFSDALVALGFTQARLQKYEWLSSYPEARPLLSAIQTSFSPHSVLTESQAATYADLAQNTPQLPDDQLAEASGPLITGAPLFPDVLRQTNVRLNAARNRLHLLHKQKHVLQELVAQKRARPRGAMSPRTPPLRRNCSSDQHTVRKQLDILRTSLQGNTVSFEANVSVDTYYQREQAFFDELLTYAQQTLQERVPNRRSDPADPRKLSIKQLVNSYATIKADQCVHEARLARANALLTSISLSKGSYLEMSTSSMHSLIKDLRDRGAKALKAKVKQVEEQAQDSLWSRIHTISLTEALRQQKIILELAHFCAVLCLEQRIRILCFSLATRSQKRQYRDLFDALLSLSMKPQSHTVIDQRILPQNSAYVAQSEDNNLLEMQRALEAMTVTEDEFTKTTISALENDIFDSEIQVIADMITDFVNRIGCENSWLRLESHPEYMPLLEEFEKILSHNTSILEAVLTRRGSPNAISPQSQNWVRVVNSGQYGSM